MSKAEHKPADHKGTEHKGDHKVDHKHEHKDDKKPVEAKSEKGKEGQAGEAKKGEGKKTESTPHSKNKGHEPIAGHCCGWGCKALATRFNFCTEHFDHFKFGLLKKTGEPVSDYEKKFEHFAAFQAKQRVQKVA